MKYVAALLTIAASSAFAGGTASNAKILEFMDKGNEEYRLVIIYPIQPSSPEQVILHLRHKPDEIGLRRPAQISADAYRKCVAKLRNYFAKRESFLLGEFGSGIVSIPEKRGEYQSNTLIEYGGTCYSFAGPV